jgi:hypothetical protein
MKHITGRRLSRSKQPWDTQTSLVRIAKQAGIGKGVVLYYLKSKEALTEQDDAEETYLKVINETK